MNKPKNWIYAVGILLTLVFGGKAAFTDKDIPPQIDALIVLIFTAGLASDTISQVAQKFTGSKNSAGEDTK